MKYRIIALLMLLGLVFLFRNRINNWTSSKYMESFQVSEWKNSPSAQVDPCELIGSSPEGLEDVFKYKLKSANMMCGDRPLVFLAIESRWSGKRESLELLVKYGANLNKPDTRGVTPIQYAQSIGDSDTVQFLKDHGVLVPDNSALLSASSNLENAPTANAFSSGSFPQGSYSRGKLSDFDDELCVTTIPGLDEKQIFVQFKTAKVPKDIPFEIQGPEIEIKVLFGSEPASFSTGYGLAVILGDISDGQYSVFYRAPDGSRHFVAKLKFDSSTSPVASGEGCLK